MSGREERRDGNEKSGEVECVGSERKDDWKSEIEEVLQRERVGVVVGREKAVVKERRSHDVERVGRSSVSLPI